MLRKVDSHRIRYLAELSNRTIDADIGDS